MKKRFKFLIAIVIALTIYASILFYQFYESQVLMTQVGKSRVAVQKVGDAVRAFYERCQRYPSEAEGLNVLTERTFECNNWTGPLLLSIPQDSWGRDLIYIYKGLGNTFDVISLGADGIERGASENQDISYQATH